MADSDPGPTALQPQAATTTRLCNLLLSDQSMDLNLVRRLTLHTAIQRSDHEVCRAQFE